MRGTGRPASRPLIFTDSHRVTTAATYAHTTVTNQQLTNTFMIEVVQGLIWSMGKTPLHGQKERTVANTAGVGDSHPYGV